MAHKGTAPGKLAKARTRHLRLQANRDAIKRLRESTDASHTEVLQIFDSESKAWVRVRVFKPKPDSDYGWEYDKAVLATPRRGLVCGHFCSDGHSFCSEVGPEIVGKVNLKWIVGGYWLRQEA